MKISIFINTSGLIYDDRLMKEISSLKGLGSTINVFVFEKKNHKEKGIHEDIFSYEGMHLLTRKWFPEPKKLLWIKAIEFNTRLLIKLIQSRGTIAWLHNMEMWGSVIIALFLRKIGVLKKVIWDQHELPPPGILNNALLRKLFCITIRKCDFVVAANKARVEYVTRQLDIFPVNFRVINNYPSLSVINMPVSAIDPDLKKWLVGEPYILFQGIASKDRRIIESAKAIARDEKLKIVIVGPIHSEIISELKTIFKEQYDSRVFCTGMVPQKNLYNYIDHCMMSLIFYANKSMNSWLCEPNRFYQAICRGRPVVCGSNPTMKSIVDHYKCGYVVDGDGDNPAEIYEGIKYVISNYSHLLENINATKNCFTWEANYESFVSIFK